MKRRKPLSFGKRFVLIAVAGGICVFLLLILAFCGGMSGAGESLGQDTETADKAFYLYLDGSAKSIEELNISGEPAKAISVTLTPKAPVRLENVSFSLSALKKDVTYIAAVVGGKTPLAEGELKAGTRSFSLVLSQTFEEGTAIAVTFSEEVEIEGIFAKYQNQKGDKTT